MTDLGERYDELMRYRAEAFERYNANEFSIFTGPPSSVHLPSIGLEGHGRPSKALGPIRIVDRPPVEPHVRRIIATAHRAVRILEIGPGRGYLASSLRREFGDKIAGYYGLERDRSVRGDYTLVESVLEVPPPVDLAIAAEVIEHMSADAFSSEILEPLRSALSADGKLVLSTPNPTAPGGIARDFTHVQNYPWYDLYAILRTVFERIDVYRVHYAFSPRRLVQVLPRMVLCTLLELEWCDQLVCVAATPRRKPDEGSLEIADTIAAASISAAASHV